MKFLSGVFERKAASKSGAIARATAGSDIARAGQYWSVGKWDVEKAVKDGYERVLWVFRCVDAIASAQAEVPMIVRRGDIYDGEIADSYPDVNRLLNRRSNSYEDSWMFRYRLSSIALLSRKGVFVEMIKSNSGGIAELHLLPPGQCEPIPDPRRFVKGYRVYRADGRIDELSPDQVIWIRLKPHPTDPYEQMTPLVAAGLSAETDYFARLFNRNFLANDGRPGMLISVKGQMGNGDAEELKRRFSGGPQRAGQVSVIEGDGVDVADLSGNPRDVQWMEAIRGSKEEILLAFGTPESVLGNASGRTFDNADAEFEIFWKQTMKQHCNSIGRAFDILTQNTNDEDFVVHDYTKVDVLQRDERRRRDKKADEFAAGLATLDDYLEEAGQQPLNVPASRVYIHPKGIVVAKNPEDQKAVSALPVIGSPAMADPNAASQSARQGAYQGVQQGQRNFENIVAARAMQLAGKEEQEPVETKEYTVEQNPYAELRGRIEGYVEGALTQWTERQEKVVNERLHHTKVRKGTRHWEGETKDASELKALDADYVVEREKWVNEVQNSLEGMLRKVARQEANRAARDIASTGLLDVILGQGEGNPSGKNPLQKLLGSDSDVNAVIDSVMVPILDVVQKSAHRQSQRIAETIREMDADGASLDEIKREVKKMMSTRSQWRKALAVNVTTSTLEGAKAAVYSHGGPYVEKTWKTEADERVRPSHWKLHRKSKKAHQPFVTGGHKLMFPGDPTAPVEEVVNCRCWLSWKVVGGKVPSNRRIKDSDIETERKEYVHR